MSFDGVGGVEGKQFKLHANPANLEFQLFYNTLHDMPEIFAVRIRIQNLRFAQLLCGAQELCESQILNANPPCNKFRHSL